MCFGMAQVTVMHRALLGVTRHRLTPKRTWHSVGHPNHRGGRKADVWMAANLRQAGSQPQQPGH